MELFWCGVSIELKLHLDTLKSGVQDARKVDSPTCPYLSFNMAHPIRSVLTRNRKRGDDSVLDGVQSKDCLRILALVQLNIAMKVDEYLGELVQHIAVVDIIHCSHLPP